MSRIVLATLLGGLAFAPKLHAQSEPVVLVLDAGADWLDADAVGRVIASAIDRPIVRLTDARAPQASGQLSIAYTTPDQWVLRYESRGEVVWASERIARSESPEHRIAALTRSLLEEVARRPDVGSGDYTLPTEILDPFADDPRPRPPSALDTRFSEVLDPFEENPRRVRQARSWSEVLDPWDSAR